MIDTFLHIPLPLAASHGFFETVAGQWHSHGFFETIAGQWGQDMMLILLSIRWIASVATIWMNASVVGRSLLFDGLCLLAYAFGLAHHIAISGAGWATSLTGVIYLVNIGMIATLIFLILIIRNAISRVRALR